jgi:hypothetical protein
MTDLTGKVPVWLDGTVTAADNFPTPTARNKLRSRIADPCANLRLLPQD